jgi:hypothetical protein
LADFTNSTVSSHPILPHDSPFVIDLRGEWPTDCHPGEQKPVIRQYTGEAVLIEFEIIVEHVTCNDVSTPYRVLVDMSDVIDSVTPPESRTDIDVTVRFDNAELNTSILFSCALISPCPYSPASTPDIYPEAGLYGSMGLDKQGLLLSRQKTALAVFPLVYDESGSSEWLFGGGQVIQDVYFTDLYELTGGQCLGCPPPDNPPQMETTGKLTLLMDSQGLVQVKVNDSLFTTFEQSEFGYGSSYVGGNPQRRIPDLSGRWAFVDSYTKDPQTAQLIAPTSLLTLVFDITLQSVFVADTPETNSPAGYATFSAHDTDGVIIAEMVCEYGFDIENPYDENFSCTLNSSNLDDGNEPYTVEMLSPERMVITGSQPIFIPAHEGDREIVVRID